MTMNSIDFFFTPTEWARSATHALSAAPRSLVA
jgi:hypothetical protein